MKRLANTKRLADKWGKIGYKIVAISFFNGGSAVFHLEKSL